MACSPWGRRESDMTEGLGHAHMPQAQFHRRGSFLAPTPRKEECAINLPSQRVSAYQDKIVHLNNFNIINVNNLVGTEIYGKSVSIWQILIG